VPGVAYATAAQYKEWVGLELVDTLDDNVIARALLAASHGVDNFCHTHFWQTTAGTNRVFDACDTRRLRINDAAAVTAVATDKDGDGVFETAWAAGDYQLLPLNPSAAPETLPFSEIWAIGTLTFPPPVYAKRLGRVQVTGTWGWPVVPDAVVQSTLLLANRLVKRKESPEGVSGFDEFGVIRISARDDPDAVRYLTPYRTTRRAGGWAFA
jgi:hypothetical protein